MDGKRCPHCKNIKPYADFDRNKAQKDGFSPYCKVCKKATAKPSEAVQEKARLYARERMQRIRAADPTFNKRTQKEAYEKHRERRVEKARAYRAANPELIRQQAREYRLRNLPIVRAREAAKNARRYAAPGTFTAQDAAAQYSTQEGCCFWCKKPVGENYHFDHVMPLAKGGTNFPENIVIACRQCNQQKSDLLPEEWLRRLTNVPNIE